MENQNPEEDSAPSPSSGETFETRSIEGAPDTPESGARPSPGVSNRSWILMSVIGILTLLLIAGMSAVGGAQAGRDDRMRVEATQKSDQIIEQYVMALEDVASGRDDLARQRFEWIIQRDPSFPGVPEQLADVLMRMSITATPTLAPTPTLTPTPDTRTRDELYQAARQAMAGSDWENAIETLLRLRKEDPTFNPIEVDGLLYISLRYRGLNKIKNADLEGGTYDLALAERFGPLDAEATNYRTWAELYVTGSSFWDVDWAQAVNYFSQLKLVAPYLRDGSGWTSIDRYRIALTRYGDWLALQELWCEAQEQYELALAESSDPAVQPTAVYAGEQCASPEEDFEEEPLVTITPTLPGTSEIPPVGETPPVETPPAGTPGPVEEPEATPAPGEPAATPTP